MKQPDKIAMVKYLKFQYWTKRLLEQGVITDKEYARLLSAIRTRCGIQ